MRNFDTTIISDFFDDVKEVTEEVLGTDKIYPVAFPFEDLEIPSVSYGFSANQTPYNKVGFTTDYTFEVWTLTKDYEQSLEFLEKMADKFNKERKFFLDSTEDHFSQEYRAYSVRMLFRSDKNSML